MCTVAGISIMAESHFEPKQIMDCFNGMLVSGEDRGRDATGVAVFYLDGRMDMIRLPIPASEFVKDLRYQAFMMKIDFDNVTHLIANNRAQPIPEGDSCSETNRQPVRFKGWIGSHNGTISNDKDIAEKYGFEISTQIDSEMILQLFDMYYMPGIDNKELIQKVCKELSGGLTFACASNKNPTTLYLMSNFKPLTLAYDPARNILIYNSEKKNIEANFEKDSLLGLLRYETIKPYTGIVVDVWNGTIEYCDIQTKITAYIPETNERRALVICSGGLDSCTAATVAKKLHGMDVTLLHFNYGQIAYESERRAVLATAEVLGGDAREIDMSWLGHLTTSPLVDANTILPLGIDSAESTKCWVPARNLLILSVAAAYAEAKGYKYIYSGFNLEEGGSYPDNVIPFFKAMNHVLNYGTLTRVQLVLSLERLMKPEIIKLGTYLGTPLDKTWSCDLGNDKPCGTCGCCFTRQMAYVKAGLPDPQIYLGEPEKPVWLTEGEFTPNDVSIEQILEKVKERRFFD